MKIGTKFTICFAVMALLPLAIASFVYIRSSVEFGKEMTERGQALLSERVTRDLRRATEQGAVAFEKLRRDIVREARFFSSDVVSRLGATASDMPEADIPSGFSFTSQFENQTGQNTPISLEQVHVSIAESASRDQVAGTLQRLAGLGQTARTIYLRNRGLIDSISVIMENGIRASYPSGAAKNAEDIRESDRYLHTLESGAPSLFVNQDSQGRIFSVTHPLQRENGTFVGIADISINILPVLERTLGKPHVPSEASAYLLFVPEDDPQLMPHEVAILRAGSNQWQMSDRSSPILLDGDDAWLKVVSDIRTGVSGLEYVERQQSREVWAFLPIGRTSDGVLHLAASIPESVITAARTRAETVVHAAFKQQLRNAAILAIVTGLVAITFAVFAARSLTGPIRKLYEAATRLGEGDFSVRVEAGTRDELGMLAEGFNQMVPSLEEQVRVKQDLHIAEEIQQHLVGRKAFDLAGFDISGKTIYCDETGGDYQDLIALSDGRLLALNGDVTGHGVGAAILMATARASIRTNAHHFASIDKLIDAANRQLAEDISGGRSLSLFCALLEPRNHTIEWLSAGHDPVLVFDPEQNDFITLEGEDIPLGVDSAWRFSITRQSLPKNSVLVATTDGVRETQNTEGSQYGWDRLKNVIRHSSGQSSNELIGSILGDLETFRGTSSVKDDVSIMVIRPL